MIAATVEELTPQWLTAALAEAGHDVEIVGVHSTRIGTGQIGSTYLLDLEHGRGAGVPARVVAKLPAREPAARAAASIGYRSELTFYRFVLQTVAVRAPYCWYAALADDAQSFTLLLEDLTPAVPGVQANGCTPAQASAAIANLALLHAPRWNDASLDELRVARTERKADMVQAMQQDATEKLAARLGDLVSEVDVETFRAAAGRTATWLREFRTPFTVIHGDYRLDNLMFHPDGEVIALDWQTLALGSGSRDLAYFLGNSITIDERRERERVLVAAYHAALVDNGVTDYSAEQCWADYRVGHMQGAMITTLGFYSSQGERSDSIDRMFAAMFTRAAAAIRDHGTLDLVG